MKIAAIAIVTLLALAGCRTVAVEETTPPGEVEPDRCFECTHQPRDGRGVEQKKQ